MREAARHTSTRSLRRNVSKKLTSAGLKAKIRENLNSRRREQIGPR